jgi:hypothetical protein
MVDLKTLPGYTHETFALGDMADVIDIDCDNINDRCRIIHYKYDFFHQWNVDTMELGDPIKRLAATISNASKAADFVNNIKPNASFQNLLKAIIDSAATEINGASGDYTLIDGVSTWWGSVGGVRNGKVTRATPGGIIISDDGGQSWGTAIDGAGIYADKIIVNDVYALSSGDGYTKMGGSGIVVMDVGNVVRAHLGQYATGKFGLKLTNGDIVIDGSSGKSRILLNPDDALKIQKLVGTVWTDVLSEDVNGNIIATNADISGTIRAGALYLGGTNVLTALNKINDSAVDIKASTINALSVTAGSVACENLTGTTISGKTITGSTLQTAVSGTRIVMTPNHCDMDFYHDSCLLFSIYDAITGITLMPGSGATAMQIGSSGKTVNAAGNWVFANPPTGVSGGTAVFG